MGEISEGYGGVRLRRRGRAFVILGKRELVKIR